MPFPFLLPIATFIAKKTIGELIVTTVVATTVANVANDVYQKVKESGGSSEDNKCDNNQGE